jgi:hypothetical protein
MPFAVPSQPCGTFLTFLRPTVRIPRAVHGAQQWPEDIPQKRPSYRGRRESPKLQAAVESHPFASAQAGSCLGADTVLIGPAGPLKQSGKHSIPTSGMRGI